jgi:hypothetical protein
MVDAVERAQAARNPLEQLAAKIPGFRGYQERELRREVDQLLRSELAGRLDRARDGVQRFQCGLRLSEGGLVQRLASLDKRLDLAANTLRHAGSGYSGLFDALKIREEELGRLYRFDLQLAEGIDGVLAAAQALDGEAAVRRLEEATGNVGAQIGARDEVVTSVLGA